MINKLEVDGFKSLKNFSIDFKRGLNVLIGPNGVGKTNICQAISLLHSLTTNSLFETFTQFGGVQSIFNIVENLEEKKYLKIVVFGETEGSLDSDKEGYILKFEYKIVLKLTDELLFDYEELIIRRKTKKNNYKTVIKIVQNSKNEVKVEIKDSDLIGHYNVIKKGEKNFTIKLQDQESFLPLMGRLFFSCHLILKEFSKIKSLNIDPNVARNSCDITEPHEMLGNGRYLANTVYFLNKKGEDLSEINSLLEQLIPNYKELCPKISEISRKRYFTINDDNGNSFPSNSLSDGTIKLLALLVGIISQNERTTIIEEPENYLHPYANKLLISYLRETYDDGICILTSHSETILNLIKPEELIICELENSFTKSSRIENVKEVAKIIEESGFGCGYHYISGNLGGVPKF
ncbi:MAG TPA: AAA family ATPase [Pelobium sp.]|nr:AAA family ATPase [Pelobium sp.]